MGFQDIFADNDELIANPVTGLNAEHANHACVWCNVHISER